jgi:hypothetical protein
LSCRTPIAVVNLVTAHCQFFKAGVGLGVRVPSVQTINRELTPYCGQ